MFITPYWMKSNSCCVILILFLSLGLSSYLIIALYEYIYLLLSLTIDNTSQLSDILHYNGMLV